MPESSGGESRAVAAVPGLYQLRRRPRTEVGSTGVTMNPTHTLVDRDGWLFVREAYIEPSKPQTTISYWPIGLKTYYLKANYGEEKLSGRLFYKGDGLYEDTSGLRYRLQDAGQTRMTLQETEPIPCPKT